MPLRVAAVASACILLGACQTSADNSERRTTAPSGNSIASTAQVDERPDESLQSCEGDSLPSEVFAAARPDEAAVLVQPGSRDRTAVNEVAMRVDRCGFGRGLVRRALTGGPVEFLPFPEGFREALTNFDISPDDRYITFVEFDGDYGAFGVVRTFPQGALVARSRRLAVPGGDTVFGAAEFLSDSTWAAYVCADVPARDLWVRLRAPIRGGTIVEDTVQFPLRRL